MFDVVDVVAMLPGLDVDALHAWCDFGLFGSLIACQWPCDVLARGIAKQRISAYDCFTTNGQSKTNGIIFFVLLVQPCARHEWITGRVV